jgi:hypothetical protein
MKIFRDIIISVVLPMVLLTSNAFAQSLMEPTISKSIYFGKSKPIRETKVVVPGIHKDEQQESKNILPYGTVKMKMQTVPVEKRVLQKTQGNIYSRGPLLNFEGVGNENGMFPADPNGEVSLDHYLQTVNSSFALWDKAGDLLFGPADNKTIWESLPGPWNSYYWFDPVFKYDHMADRWVVMTPSTSYSFTGPFYTMVAVSVTSDPLGEYYCYAFEFEKFNDYPKLAIWPDGYYITYNMYDAWDPETFAYSSATVIDREAMLAGEPEITMIQFDFPDPDVERFFPMATDLRGTNIPVDEPGYIITIDDHNPDNPWELSLDIYAFDPDWQEPEHSDFGIVAQFNLGNFETFVPYGPGAPQKGSNINLITMPLYLMYPITYRKFVDHESMVCCHTVWDGNIHYIKWYELRKEDSIWHMYQTGNYAPGDFHYFTPSISINGNGDMALGYTISNEDIFPCIRMTGRRADDPPGTMTFQEIELFKGLNYANNYLGWYNQNMWGDYAAMMVDPSDDTTFWFTHMYTKATTSSGNWATRIFSLNLSGEPAMPYADAGNDTLTCNILVFTTQGHAENYSSVVWTTSGDGNFIINYTPNAKYLRGTDDLNNQQVTLTMHLTGYEPGTTTADSMILYINKEPEVYAGPDDTIVSGEVLTLQGEVNFAYEYFWKTLGDGTFTDSTMLDAIYTPGPQDIENQGVTLVLTANKVSSCTGSITDSLFINIITVGVDDISDDGCMIKLYPNPSGNIITLHAEFPGNDNVISQIIDSRGKVLFTERITLENKFFEKQFDLSYLESGVYFIRLQVGDDFTGTQKFIVLR